MRTKLFLLLLGVLLTVNLFSQTNNIGLEDFKKVKWQTRYTQKKIDEGVPWFNKFKQIYIISNNESDSFLIVTNLKKPLKRDTMIGGYNDFEEVRKRGNTPVLNYKCVIDIKKLDGVKYLYILLLNKKQYLKLKIKRKHIIYIREDLPEDGWNVIYSNKYWW